MATFQKRGKRWRAIVRKKGRSPITKSFSTKGIAQTWAKEVELAIERGAFQDPRQLNGKTVGDLIKRHRAEIPEAGRTKAATFNMLERELGDVTLAELDKKRILSFCRYRKTEHGTGPATIAQDLIYLGGLLDTARAHWDIPVDREAVSDARAMLRTQGLVGRSAERDRRPTEEELERLHAYWTKPSSRPQGAPMWEIVRFAIATAMRLSEITSIRWADLHEEDRTVVIRNRKHPSKKLGNDQVVPLLGEAWEIVQAQARTAEQIFPYNPRSLSTNFTRAIMRCGIDDLHFHDLRHHAICVLFENGYQIHEVALVSGHRDWTQLKRYTQLRVKDLHR
jgi:integrase